MNGPEHFREAEAILALVDDPEWSWSTADRANALAGASVHATLALAAATALQFHLDLLSVHPSSPGSAWRQVLDD